MTIPLSNIATFFQPPLLRHLNTYAILHATLDTIHLPLIHQRLWLPYAMIRHTIA
jgi:hypothetical protein